MSARLLVQFSCGSAAIISRPPGLQAKKVDLTTDGEGTWNHFEISNSPKDRRERK